MPRTIRITLTTSILLIGSALMAAAASPNRITRPVDPGRMQAIPNNLHRRAQPQFDRGPVDPGMRMEFMLLVVKPSPAQQAELDQLLADLQNPSSPRFHQWLTPEEFGNRFGLSPGDHSKVVAWLTAEGFTVNESGRARNWVAFTGTAAQITHSLRTPIHRFQVEGEMRYSNTGDPQVPEALAGVVGGFIGLNDFQLKSQAILVNPDYTTGTTHYLVPEDYATIYNIAPLYQAGIDGAGQNIAIVGQSQVLTSDLSAFRARYNLPANPPKIMLYGGSDPGFNGAQLEGDLDLEWAGAVAPKATIYYIYGASAFTAIISAINLNVAPIVSASYGSCEVDVSVPFYRSFGQQASAQGITLLASSGDAGAASCDPQGVLGMAMRGKAVLFPAVMPEVTAVGGTMFAEGGGTYWSTTNSPNFGSALSYIPEAAWNENGPGGLLSTGGGNSVLYPRPAWQNGPGLPNDAARHVPDISLSAATHDPYYVTYSGVNVAVGGTSASAPSMAGIMALVNQYVVGKGYQSQAGLGNINPQLYRLAQAAPSVFHDITVGSNIVPCAQGSPDCVTGSFGYQTGPAYDMATGLGSVDANAFVTQWNIATQRVTSNLVLSAGKVTINDTVDATLLIGPAAGSGTPTGSVDFSVNGVSLGRSALVPRGSLQAADITFPVYRLGTGTFTVTATYSGDAAFGAGGSTRTLQVVTPTGAAAIVLGAPYTVWPSYPQPDAQGLVWQTTITLREAAGVPALVTGVSIDGQAQPVTQSLPSAAIPASTTVSAIFLFHGLAAPVTRIFLFTGVDANGNTWSRGASIDYFALPTYSDFSFTATSLTVPQNTAADPSCQWAVQVSLDDLTGTRNTISALLVGSANLSSKIASIFGTTRLDAWSSLQGTICISSAAAPGEESIEVDLSSGAFNQLLVSLVGPPASPAKITASPASLNLAAADVAHPAQASLSIDLSDKTQPWTLSLLPGNRTGAWLTASQYAGAGPATVSLTASGFGLEPGAYRALVVIQCPNAVPQFVNVPVMFVLGGSTFGPVITSVVNSASNAVTASSGMLMTIYGTKLANATTKPGTSFSNNGVSVTVNNLAAELVYISPGQINIEVPFEVGAGPGVLGLNNNGQIVAYQFQVAPAAPAIFTDGNGNALGVSPTTGGGTATLYLSGGGDVTPTLPTGFVPSANSVGTFKPVLPVSLTVGGVPAFVKLAAIAPLQIGLMQVDFVVPASVPSGPQPVVVTIGGAASRPANITVP